MALTTSSTLSSTVKPYYEKRFLLRSEENFVYEQLGTPGRIPKGEGKTVVWNRYTKPTSKDTALTEGTDPTPSGLSASIVSATLEQLGNYEQVSDILELTSVDDVIKSTMDLLAYEATLSIDTKIKDDISTSGLAIIATGAYSNSSGFTPTRNSIDANDVMTVGDLRRAKRQHGRMSAKPHTKDRFIGITHPDITFDLQGDTNWVNAHLYTEQGINAVYNGEAGELFGVRFVETAMAPILVNSGSAGTEVYITQVIGKDFFGVSKLQNLETYVDSPSPRSALRLWSDVGWKASCAAKTLNDSFCARVETAATA